MVAIFIVDAGFIDWCSLIAIVMPLPDSGTSVIATAFSGTRAARNSAATLSGSTGGTVDCAWPGAASSESRKQHGDRDDARATREKAMRQGTLRDVARRSRRDRCDYPHDRHARAWRRRPDSKRKRRPRAPSR